RTVDDGHPWTTGLDRLVKESQQRLELSVSTDHRRPQPRHAAMWLGQRPEEASRDNRSRLALQVEVDRLLEGKGGPAGQVGTLAHQDRSRSGGLLEARGDVDRISGDDQLLGCGSNRRDDLAGVDADPDLEPDPMVSLEALVE